MYMHRIPAVARVEQGVLPAAARSGETLCGGCPRAELDPVLGDPIVLGIGAQWRHQEWCGECRHVTEM